MAVEITSGLISTKVMRPSWGLNSQSHGSAVRHAIDYAMEPGLRVKRLQTR